MKSIFTLLISFLIAATCFAATPDQSDIIDSVNLRENWKTLTRDLVFPVTWTKNKHSFTYRKTVDGGFRYFTENVEKAKPQLAFDHKHIARALSKATGNAYSELSLPFDNFQFSEDSNAIQFSLNYKPWQCQLKERLCKPISPNDKRPKAFGVVRDLRVSRDNTVIRSPSGKLKAKVSEHNLVIMNNNGKTVYQTSDGTAEHFYDIDSVIWSPDEEALNVVKVRPGEANFVTRVMAAPEDQLQPKVVKQLYPKPGDRVDIDQPVLIDIRKKQQFDIDNSLFPQPYILTGFYWRDNSQSLVFQYIERGHQRERIIEIDRQTGKTRSLITEEAETFIYSWRDFFHDVSNQGEELIWLSERDGWAHLYLYDGQTGNVKNQITQGSWPVREVVHVDDNKRQIYFAASGMNEGEDPYFLHYYRVNFDGSDLTALTPERANHEVSFSDDMAYYVDVYSRVDLPNVAKLYKTGDPEPIRTIAEADISHLQEAGFQYPESFVAKGRDGESDIWGVIVKPTDFDPNRRYPVIENIYAGPHDSFVPKSFWPFGYHSGGDKVIGMQALADLGFIVVQIDGMGTANRSKAFHDVAWKNLADSGFPDRILWHKAAAKRLPWYNLDKGVGIYGASAGGQSTLGALVFHSDFYTVGVAFAGCYDNRMDKISWNEQWMGYPVGPQYAASSGVEHAKNLKGKLLLINGEQDSNVDPASTMQVVDALIKADKDFELLVVPNGQHSVGRSTGPIEYIQRRQFTFFVENLLETPLPNWNQPGNDN